MKLRRLAGIIMASIMAAGSLAACGGSKPAATTAAPAAGTTAAAAAGTTAAAAPASSGKAVTLRFAHTVPSGTPTANCIQRFCDEVTAESGGKLKIQCFPDSQLGDDDEICDQIYNGAEMIDYVDPAKMEDYYADYSILVTPYFFHSADEIAKFAWSDLGQELSDKCAESGMKVLDNMGGYYGARHIMAKKAITTPDDMKGVKFRVPSTTMWVAMANAWNASAVSVSFSEAYTALSQGVVDAIENPVVEMVAAGFQDVCPYLSVTHHMYAANGMVMNNKVFEGLDADMQELLIKKAKEFDQWTFEEVTKAENETIEQLKNTDGITVNEDVNYEAFEAASESIYSTYQGWSSDLVDRCKAQLAEMRK